MARITSMKYEDIKVGMFVTPKIELKEMANHTGPNGVLFVESMKIHLGKKYKICHKIKNEDGEFIGLGEMHEYWDPEWLEPVEEFESDDRINIFKILV